jgi:hypothetical protein
MTVYDSGESIHMAESDGRVEEWVMMESSSGKVLGQYYFHHRYTILKHLQ